jgi:hypothetical protein
MPLTARWTDRRYVERVYRRLDKGDIVFMNNRRTHTIVGVREAIEMTGAKLRHLPTYSRA